MGVMVFNCVYTLYFCQKEQVEKPQKTERIVLSELFLYWPYLKVNTFILALDGYRV